MKMRNNEILKNLCYYDKRNPDYNGEVANSAVRLPVKVGVCVCYCDNCFYGRHKLALEILKLQKAKVAVHLFFSNLKKQKLL